MATVAPAITALNGGELSPLLDARTDFEQYPRSLTLCENFVPLPQGPVQRRPGTYYVGKSKYSNKAARLVPFRFTAQRAYVLEFGDLYIRVFQDHAQKIGVSPWGAAFSADFGGFSEVVTPYTEAQLAGLKFAQSFDTLYIAHPSHAPRKLERAQDDVWTMTVIDLKDGPYLTQNTTPLATLTNSAASGSGITVTANAAAADLINGGLGFTPTDVGRLIRLSHLSGGTTSTGWGKITSRTSSNVVTVQSYDDFHAAGATASWRLGVWSETTGWPAAVGAFQDRLFWGGTSTYPERVDGSVSGSYETFWPYGPNTTSQTPLDADGVSFSLLNAVSILWLTDDSRGMLVGTTGGIFIIRANSNGGILTPANVQATRLVPHGVDAAQPARAEHSVLYAQGTGRKVRDLSYSTQTDSLQSVDVSLWGEHLLRDGVKEVAYQGLPYGVLWLVTDAGELRGLSFEKDQALVAWHRHTLGGAFGSGAPVVESIAVIPTPNGALENLWLLVKRTVNGSTERYVEFLTDFWSGSESLEDAVFSDSSLTYDSTPATTITGLGHLEGASVAVLADGATHRNCTVSSGAITLDSAASVVQLGFPTTANLQTVRLEAGAQNGTSQAKKKRMHRVTFRIWQSLGLFAGPDVAGLTAVPLRLLSSPLGSPQPVVTDDVEMVWPGGVSTEGRVYVRLDTPVPCTILGVYPQLYTEDRT